MLGADRALLACLALGSAASSVAAAPCAAFDHEHRAWTGLLARYVVEGRVDYAGIHRDARAAVSTYLDALSGVSRDCYADWSRAQRLAFWINAYNAYTVELVLEHYPVRSIRAIGWLPGSAFRTKFIHMKDLAAGDLSLDDIEHGHLRKDFGEPRIHFAMNCASVGCPMLREEAYAAARLDRQLEEQAVRFLSDRSRNRFRDGRLEVSKIFDWFKEDFEPREKYFARYADVLGEDARARDTIASAKFALQFLDYDWSLNGK